MKQQYDGRAMRQVQSLQWLLSSFQNALCAGRGSMTAAEVFLLSAVNSVLSRSQLVVRICEILGCSPASYGACADAAVTGEEREKAKKVTYGIVYGLSAWGLAKGSAGLGIEVSQAQALISSFLNHFRGVQTSPCYSACLSRLRMLNMHCSTCYKSWQCGTHAPCFSVQVQH